ncbi:MAG: winged helix-turn-helix domain-containing protein, partial [Gemmatimonadaceae bacterium]
MWSPKALPKRGPRYLALAERIAEDVASGRLRAGMQLPPQRALAAQLGIDFTTVSRAYAEARRRGLVAGHVGRGTFVRVSVATARPLAGATLAPRAPAAEPVDLS